MNGLDGNVEEKRISKGKLIKIYANEEDKKMRDSLLRRGEGTERKD